VYSASASENHVAVGDNEAVGGHDKTGATADNFHLGLLVFAAILFRRRSRGNFKTELPEKLFVKTENIRPVMLYTLLTSLLMTMLTTDGRTVSTASVVASSSPRGAGIAIGAFPILYSASSP